MKKDLTPDEALTELYTRYLNEEYISFLTYKIIKLSKRRLTKNNVKLFDHGLYLEFEKQLIPNGILNRVRRRIRAI